MKKINVAQYRVIIALWHNGELPEIGGDDMGAIFHTMKASKKHLGYVRRALEAKL